MDERVGVLQGREDAASVLYNSPIHFPEKKALPLPVLLFSCFCIFSLRGSTFSIRAFCWPWPSRTRRFEHKLRKEVIFGGKVVATFLRMHGELDFVVADELVALAKHFCLPLSVVREAREAFECYRVAEPGASSSPQRDENGAQEAAAASDNAKSEHETAPSIGAKGLQLFFQDMGSPKTAAEVRALMHDLATPPPELERLHAQERAAYEERDQRRVADESNGDAQSAEAFASHTAQLPMPPVSPAPANLDSASDDSATEAALTFPQFLYLLQRTDLSATDGEDCLAQQKAEARTVFHALDTDADGALSEKDVRAVLARLLLDETGENASALATCEGLLRVAAMHPVELRAALAECDGNADGIVTVEDFVGFMRS